MRVDDNAPAATHAPVREMLETRSVDRIHIAADSERYWVVLPEPSGKRWTLRQLDDTTGVIGPAAFISEPLDPPHDGVSWASRIVGVKAWSGLEGIAGAYIEEAYRIVRDLAYAQRPGRRLMVRIEPFPQEPEITLVAVYERWTATGLLSPALTRQQLSLFTDLPDALRWVSKEFGVDPDGWKTITEGVEYEHE
jgi:hypothetical protein